MRQNLLIVGAGVYALVAKELAESMGAYEKIAFVDDHATTTPNGINVIGTTADINALADEYHHIVVAIGNPGVRMQLIRKIEQETRCLVATLIAPSAYVSPSSFIGKGCIIEPRAVVHTGCMIEDGCLISPGAVVNHCARLCEGVHVDCNATVGGYTVVPSGTKVNSGEVFRNGPLDVAELFSTIKKQTDEM
jgi:UDP-3-O-[3-hydroxymyristoyl] glucosamine N-acyltransferase